MLNGQLIHREATCLHSSFIKGRVTHQFIPPTILIPQTLSSNTPDPSWRNRRALQLGVRATTKQFPPCSIILQVKWRLIKIKVKGGHRES